MSVSEILTLIFFTGGFICILLSAVGVLKFPTFLTRLHASGIAETLGIMLFSAGFIASEGPGLVSVKIVLIVIIMLIVNPVATHIIARAERRCGRLDGIRITDTDLKISSFKPEKRTDNV